MITPILTKFKNFRNRLFKLFPYRAGATMDLIDAVCAETNVNSVVKLSLSDLFRRKYSSLTDVLSSLLRINLKKPPATEEKKEQTLKVTQLLAEECAPDPKDTEFVLFAIDCSHDARIYGKKVADRTIVHAPNHVPGQKPITIGHEYSILVYLPNASIDKELHWAVPLSERRVESNQSGIKVGFAQLEEIVNETVFKNYLCVNVSDAAYSTRSWVIGMSKPDNTVHIARMRGNRKVFRKPPLGIRTKRGRPLIYGEEIFLSDPSVPDVEEITTFITRSGCEYEVTLERWNDVIMKGSCDEPTHEHPFDILRITVKDKYGKIVYKRPLWLMIVGKRRKEVTSKQAFISYGQRYDIEHYIRFAKQKLGVVNSQTCETRHEENWHYIGLLSYNMLYHARKLTQPVFHPWEKQKVHSTTTSRPTQVQRDYGRIIRGIGTPAPIPKPRGKSSGREKGCKIKERDNQPVIRKSSDLNSSKKTKKKRSPTGNKGIQAPSKDKKVQKTPMRRIWPTNRAPPVRC